MPALEGRAAFHARVSANALAIVARQLELRADAEAAAHARLEALLGEQGDIDALERVLCDRIRHGGLGPDSPGLLAHLRATTLDKLAVDSAPVRRLPAREGASGGRGRIDRVRRSSRRRRRPRSSGAPAAPWSETRR